MPPFVKFIFQLRTQFAATTTEKKRKRISTCWQCVLCAWQVFFFFFHSAENHFESSSRREKMFLIEFGKQPSINKCTTRKEKLKKYFQLKIRIRNEARPRCNRLRYRKCYSFRIRRENRSDWIWLALRWSQCKKKTKFCVYAWMLRIGSRSWSSHDTQFSAYTVSVHEREYVLDTISIWLSTAQIFHLNGKMLKIWCTNFDVRFRIKRKRELNRKLKRSLTKFFN